MTIGVELEAQILRYYHVEKWRCGTIARQLHVHRGTVQRVLAQAGLPRVGGMLDLRRSMPTCRLSMTRLRGFRRSRPAGCMRWSPSAATVATLTISAT